MKSLRSTDSMQDRVQPGQQEQHNAAPLFVLLRLSLGILHLWRGLFNLPDLSIKNNEPPTLGIVLAQRKSTMFSLPLQILLLTSFSFVLPCVTCDFSEKCFTFFFVWSSEQVFNKNWTLCFYPINTKHNRIFVLPFKRLTKYNNQ